MADCNALKKQDLVLYHPLDDFTETVQSQTWTGNTSFVTGAVGSGVSAINTFGSSIGSGFTWASGLGYSRAPFIDKSHIIWINSTLIAAVYNSTSAAGSHVLVSTANVSGTTITGLNQPTIVDGLESSMFSIIKMTSSQFVIGWAGRFTGKRKFVVGTVDSSGLVTIGTQLAITTPGNGQWGGPSIRLDNTRFISSVPDILGADHDMFIGQISGSGSSATITNGSIISVGVSGLRARAPGFAMWPSSIGDTIVSGVAFWNEATTTNIRATQISISGLTITQNSTILTNALHENHGNGSLLLGSMSNTLALTDKVIIHNFNGFTNTGTKHRSNVVIGRVNSSGQLTFTDPILTPINFGESSAGQQLIVSKVGLETDQTLNINIFHEQSSNSKWVDRPGTIPLTSGGVQFGSATEIYDISSTLNKMGPISHFNNGDKRVVLGSQNISGIIVEQDVFAPSSVLTAVSGSLYTSASNAGRMTFGTWVRDPLMTGSFKIGRSFDVTVNPDDIVLDPSGLVWNVSLSGVLNDSNIHLVLLDFESQGGNNWKLRTSIDGATWVDRGIQASGTLASGITDSTPQIIFENNEFNLNRWIDEVAVWKDATLFTDQELSNLFTLGSVIDAPLCDYLLHFPPTTTGSINLFITSSTQQTSNIDLFVSSFIQQTSNINLFTGGLTNTSGNIPLFLAPPELVFESIQLSLQAESNASGSISLSILGPIQTSNNFDLSINGTDVFNNNIELFTQGNTTASGNITLILNGSTTATDNIDLFMGGVDTTSGNIILFLDVPEIVSGFIKLFLKSGNLTTDSIPLTIIGPVLISDNVDLFVNGIDTLSNSITLFLDSPELISNTIPLTLLTEGSTFDSTNLFINGLGIINNNIDLTLNGHESIPDSIPTPNFVLLSITGFSTTIDNIDLFVSGQDININNNNLPLFVDGQGTTPSSIPLFISGVDFIFNNSNLFVNGSSTISDNTTLFLGVSGLPTPTVSSGLTLEELFKTNTHDPQIIGNVGFIGVSGSVTIEIFILNEGSSVSGLTLLDNTCYPIGNTGRWGWSTEHLPPIPNPKPLYHYIMTAPDTSTFEGEFILDRSEKLGHPRSDDNVFNNML